MESNLELFILIIPLFFLLLGFFCGRMAEWAHYKNLDQRENELAHFLLSDLKTFPGGSDPTQGAAHVMGQVVIATDYMKTFLANFRKIVGGEMKSYHSLMIRGRREAVLRMQEEAHRLGYNAICNVRVGFSAIGGIAKKGPPMIEVFASGTAYRSPKDTPT